MKVLVIEPCFVGYGGYFRSYNICISLSKKNISAVLLVSSRKTFQISIKKTKINKYFHQYELPRLAIFPYFNGRILRALLALWAGLWGKFDVIHACVPTQLEANIPAFFLKLAGKKVVIDWDDYWMGTPIFAGHNMIKKYIEFCEKKSPKFFENIVVVSDFLEEKAKKWGAKRTLKLINGVNTGQFDIYTREEAINKLNLEEDKKYLLAFGNSYANDRARLLLETFERIHKLDPNVYLLFNLDLQKIFQDQRLEKERSLECLKNIINVGYIRQNNLGYFLGVCEAVLFLQGETEDEIACFPIRIGSYLNGESVIIINDVDSETGNTLKKYNCAIIEKDIAVLAEKAIGFLKDPDLQKKLKSNVIAAKRDLSWDNLIIKLIAFYKSIE